MRRCTFLSPNWNYIDGYNMRRCLHLGSEQLHRDGKKKINEKTSQSTVCRVCCDEYEVRTRYSSSDIPFRPMSTTIAKYAWRTSHTVPPGGRDVWNLNSNKSLLYWIVRPFAQRAEIGHQLYLYEYYRIFSSCLPAPLGSNSFIFSVFQSNHHVLSWWQNEYFFPKAVMYHADTTTFIARRNLFVLLRNGISLWNAIFTFSVS